MWTIIGYFTRFCWRLYMATKFAVLDYDSQLQKTKTPNQRLLIWLAITGVTLVLLLFVLNLIGKIILTPAHFRFLE